MHLLQIWQCWLVLQIKFERCNDHSYCYVVFRWVASLLTMYICLKNTGQHVCSDFAVMSLLNQWMCRFVHGPDWLQRRLQNPFVFAVVALLRSWSCSVRTTCADMSGVAWRMCSALQKRVTNCIDNCLFFVHSTQCIDCYDSISKALFKYYWCADLHQICCFCINAYGSLPFVCASARFIVQVPASSFRFKCCDAERHQRYAICSAHICNQNIMKLQRSSCNMQLPSCAKRCNIARAKHTFFTSNKILFWSTF